MIETANQVFKKGKVPNLRFPGFVGEWEVKRLGDVAERIVKKNIENNKNVLTISAQYGLINQMKFFKKSVSANDVTGYYILEKGDFAYNKSYSNGYPMGAIKYLVNYDKGVVSTLYICFKFSDEINKSFAQQFFESGKHNSEIAKIAQEGARNHGLLNIGINDFFNIKISVTSILEQQKIASFLALVDKKILSQNKIIEELETLIKGISEKLFSQKIRFKEFEDDWKVQNLGNFLIEQNERTNISNEHRILSSTAKGLFYQDDYFNKEVASKDNSGYKILRKNQLVFSPQNLWLGNINVNTKFETGIVSPSYKIFSFNENYVLTIYCKFFFKSSKMMFEYQQCSEQGASIVRRNLNIDLFLDIEIYTPSIGEQNKVARFLSSIKNKIQVEKSLLEKYELQKNICYKTYSYK